MNISIPESTEIVMELIEEDNAGSQSSYEIYAGATALADVLYISKSEVIKRRVWSRMWVLVFTCSFSSKHFPLAETQVAGQFIVKLLGIKFR